MSDDPMDEIELKRELAGIARIARLLYLELVEQGFTPAEALALTTAKLTQNPA